MILCLRRTLARAARRGEGGSALVEFVFLGVLLLLVGIELQVRRIEEPYLARVHGTAYADYAARTGRFLPRLGRLTRTPTQPSPARQETAS